MKRGYVDTSRGQIHYATEGSGEPLLLLHQSSNSWQVYSRMITALAPDYQVIAMDNPGLGGSDPLPQPLELADVAESVAYFLDGLGVDKVKVFGHHTGASIAGEFAAGWPKRVEALVLSGYPLVHQNELDIYEIGRRAPSASRYSSRHQVGNRGSRESRPERSILRERVWRNQFIVAVETSSQSSFPIAKRQSWSMRTPMFLSGNLQN